MIKETYINVGERYANHGIKGDIHLVDMDELHIDQVSLQHKTKQEKQVLRDQKHIELFFLFQGEHFYNSNKKQCVNTSTGRFSFFHLPNIDGSLAFNPVEGNYSSIGIELSIEYLERVFNGDLELLGEFGKSLYSERESAFSSNVMIQPQMKRVLQDLVHNDYTGTMKKMYIESKIIEILLQVIKHGGESRYDLSGGSLSRSDIDKLYYVRELVSNNLQNPYSLRELSRLAGINEFKLKKGFKEIFSTTIFNHLYDERMVLGQKLLIEQDTSIADIAQQVGYKNPTHFTAAFKRKFNELPKEVKSGKLIQF
ncbi:helix-turn-helix transcriptional regulator [Myroides sp. N17-2]|uniref:helix-turn-helix transcriptional regulator n=1 Tax=Myroides sp. N17-2 TaxID=2030799 RepID=UPI000EFA3E8E|nr:AraC family transcriptional regulator [Myroides sp. N17-2]